MLTNVFETVLEMNLKAAVVFAAVILIRLLLRRAPKKWSYMLWAAVGFRLLFPVSFRSLFSIFTPLQRTSVADTAFAEMPLVPGVEVSGEAFSPAVPPVVPGVSAEPAPPAVQWPGLAEILGVIWLLGIGAMLVWGVYSSIKLNSKLKNAVRYRDNIFFSDSISSPFVFGLFRPKIYVPFGLDSAQTETVLAHEFAHLKRFDHAVKLLSYLLLCVHWFDPFVWAAFVLMGKDMEMSCDERVLKNGGIDAVGYSSTLLSLAEKKSFPSPCPIGFGESGVKTRIKNALRWRRPGRIIAIAAPILVLAVLCACSFDPANRETGFDVSGEYGIWSVEYESPGEWVEYSSGELPSLRIRKETDGGMAFQVRNDPNFPAENWITLADIGLEKLSDRAFESVDPSVYDAERLVRENVCAFYGTWEFSADHEAFVRFLHQEDGNDYAVLGYRATDGEDQDRPGDIVSYIFCVERMDDLRWSYAPFTSYTGNYFMRFYTDLSASYTEIRIRTDNGSLVAPDRPEQEYTDELVIGADECFAWCPEAENAEYSPADSAKLEITVKNGRGTVSKGEIGVTLLPNRSEPAVFEWTYSVKYKSDGDGPVLRDFDGLFFITDKTDVTQEQIELRPDNTLQSTGEPDVTEEVTEPPETGTASESKETTSATTSESVQTEATEPPPVLTQENLPNDIMALYSGCTSYRFDLDYGGKSYSFAAVPGEALSAVNTLMNNLQYFGMTAVDASEFAVDQVNEKARISFEEVAPFEAVFYNSGLGALEVTDIYGERHCFVATEQTSGGKVLWNFVVSAFNQAEWSRKTYYTGVTAEDAVDDYCSGTFCEAQLNFSEINSKLILDWSIIECSIKEKSEDGNIVVFHINSAVRAAYPEQYVYAGSSYRIGDWIYSDTWVALRRMGDSDQWEKVTSGFDITVEYVLQRYGS